MKLKGIWCKLRRLWQLYSVMILDNIIDIMKLDRNMASSLLHGLYLLGKTCFKIVFSKWLHYFSMACHIKSCSSNETSTLLRGIKGQKTRNMEAGSYIFYNCCCISPANGINPQKTGIFLAPYQYSNTCIIISGSPEKKTKGKKNQKFKTPEKGHGMKV